MAAEDRGTVRIKMPIPIFAKANLKRLRGRAYISWSPRRESKADVGALHNIV